MGYLTRKPDNSNDLGRKVKHPWAEESEIMDVTALALNGLILRCIKCNRWSRHKHIVNNLCPDCTKTY